MNRIPARLVLSGTGSAEATIEVVHQPRTKRLAMVLVTVGAAVAVKPVVFLVPPDLECSEQHNDRSTPFTAEGAEFAEAG